MQAILKLETKGLPLNEAVGVLESVQANLKISKKKTLFLEKVVRRNKGFLSIKQISSILTTGKAKKSNDFFSGLSPDEILAFEFALIALCYVERVFSVCNRILEDWQCQLLSDNLKRYVVIHCNKISGDE